MRTLACSLGLLVVLSCAHPQVPAVPTLPPYLETALGRIPIQRMRNPTVAGDAVLGAWFWDERRIVIAADLNPMVAWHTLEHEACHVALDAAGVTNLVAGPTQELVCDAIATARLHDRFGSLEGVP